mmetsp:Transcript_31238/g.46668  ORF Transcript_31238/g.46668 Transcript_31238/m.46668 type:complete len:92 (-) Transcript_31238:231-506(-)
MYISGRKSSLCSTASHSRCACRSSLDCFYAYLSLHGAGLWQQHEREGDKLCLILRKLSLYTHNASFHFVGNASCGLFILLRCGNIMLREDS